MGNTVKGFGYDLTGCSDNTVKLFNEINPLVEGVPIDKLDPEDHDQGETGSGDSGE